MVEVKIFQTLNNHLVQKNGINQSPYIHVIINLLIIKFLKF